MLVNLFLLKLLFIDACGKQEQRSYILQKEGSLADFLMYVNKLYKGYLNSNETCHQCG